LVRLEGKLLVRLEGKLLVRLEGKLLVRLEGIFPVGLPELEFIFSGLLVLLAITPEGC